MSKDPRQIASAHDLATRYGRDALVLTRALALNHHDESVRDYWAGVLRLIEQRFPLTPSKA